MEMGAPEASAVAAPEASPAESSGTVETSGAKLLDAMAEETWATEPKAVAGETAHWATAAVVTAAELGGVKAVGRNAAPRRRTTQDMKG